MGKYIVLGITGIVACDHCLGDRVCRGSARWILLEEEWKTYSTHSISISIFSTVYGKTIRGSQCLVYKKNCKYSQYFLRWPFFVKKSSSTFFHRRYWEEVVKKSAKPFTHLALTRFSNCLDECLFQPRFHLLLKGRVNTDSTIDHDCLKKSQFSWACLRIVGSFVSAL